MNLDELLIRLHLLGWKKMKMNSSSISWYSPPNLAKHTFISLHEGMDGVGRIGATLGYKEGMSYKDIAEYLVKHPTGEPYDSEET